jgi:hypothetical protein
MIIFFISGAVDYSNFTKIDKKELNLYWKKYIFVREKLKK